MQVQDEKYGSEEKKEKLAYSIGVRNDKSKDVPEFLKAYINVSPEEVVENIAKFNELTVR